MFKSVHALSGALILLSSAAASAQTVPPAPETAIRLSGAVDDKGTTGTAGVVASIAFVPVAGFFVTGTSAQIPTGAPVKAFLDEDVSVAGALAAQPLQVSAGI
ncbi:hypothetical protein [Sphingosinicella sp. BN140058]|uniref:hypothetical protein n=1 Tax=Sphingosinicella sp. BN140058 TaxID=1892855 RepID=UPI00101382C0|nr:hypothetical protein ETR14_20020 [Sphingosinicella sp. BN140058]